MTTLITVALLGLLGTTPDPEGVTPPPPTPSAADSVVAAAFAKDIDTAATNLKPEVAAAPVGASAEWTNLVAPLLALLGLAALAFGLSRRRRATGRNIRIVETASLGPKRSLVVADVLGERLVLAVSEAGVSVLATKPAPAYEPEPAVTQLVDLQPASPRPMPKMGFLARVLGKTPAPTRFEDLLGESIEDQELRAKLAAGMRGSVP